MNDNNFQFEVLIHGRPAYEYFWRGETLIEGRRGSEFTLRVRNNSRRRAVAVLSVDGLSVMTGQRASQNDSGYVVEPHDYVDIPGWRLNNQQVAHFFFASLPQAYAAQMGTPENIGVIGAIFFFEKTQRPHYNDYDTLRSLEATRGLTFGAMAKGGGIGTGFGRRTEHEVTSVHFDREGFAASTMTIRYDEAQGLRDRGIRIVSAHDQGDRVIDAKPFPGDEPGATPPPDWRG